MIAKHALFHKEVKVEPREQNRERWRELLAIQERRELNIQEATELRDLRRRVGELGLGAMLDPVRVRSLSREPGDDEYIGLIT